MKKIKLTALLLATLTLISCLGYLPIVAADNGMAFNSYNIYSTSEPMTQFPLTSESTIYFPADTPSTTNGGVILGNYQDDKSASFTLEIKNGGTPVLTLVDTSKNTYTFTFNNANVSTGKQVHIALTIDTAASTVSLYIDGALAQTLKQRLPASIESTLKNVVCIGGDNRRTIANAVSTYNEKYFKGEMQSIALYSDVRTSDEIKNDFDSKSFDSKGNSGSVSLCGISVKEHISIKRNVGRVMLKDCAAPEISVKTTTGSVCGRLPSNTAFTVSTKTGKVEIPKVPLGEAITGRCEIKTNTGNIRFE